MLIRVAARSDALPLSHLLNNVVDEGDKTAIDVHLSETEFAEWFLSGSHCLSCAVAQDDSARLLGFQAAILTPPRRRRTVRRRLADQH